MEQTTWDGFSIDHKKKTVTLQLTHIYNPQCKGCKAMLAVAKDSAKNLGYQFILKEPKKDLPFSMNKTKNKKEILGICEYCGAKVEPENTCCWAKKCMEKRQKDFINGLMQFF